MTSYKWEPAQIPDEHKSALPKIGWVGLVFGIIAIWAGLDSVSEYTPSAVWFVYGGAALIFPSMLCLFFGCVIDELRKAAFRKALRAGEVEIIDAPDNKLGSKTSPDVTSSD